MTTPHVNQLKSSLEQTLAESEADQHKQHGDDFRTQGRLYEAASAYRKAISLAPTHIGALNNLALTLMDQGDKTEPEHLLRQALALSPDDPQLITNLGVALFHTEQYREAIELHRRAISLSPEDPIAWANLGSTLIQSKQEEEEAVECYRRAIALNPGFERATNALAQVEQHITDTRRINYKVY